MDKDTDKDIEKSLKIIQATIRRRIFSKRTRSSKSSSTMSSKNVFLIETIDNDDGNFKNANKISKFLKSKLIVDKYSLDNRVQFLNYIINKLKDIKDDDLKLLYKSVVGLIWGDYDYKNGVKKGYISSSLKLPNDYNRDFFIYRQDKDIYDNIVKKEELYEGSQKRFIYWVEKIQK